MVDQANRPYAVVTGASRGLGRLFALSLAKQGRPLVLAARSAENLEATRAAIVAQGSTAPVHCCAVDLTTPEGRAALHATCAPLAVDLVINNAGFGIGGAFDAASSELLRAMLRLNVEAVTELAHYFLPKLEAQGGTLVNLASQAAFQPIPKMAAYAASKAYVLHLSEALNRELRGRGVAVVCVCPPPTATDFFAKAAIDLRQTRLRPLAPQGIVDETLAGIARRQAIVLPGLRNKLTCSFSRLLPRSLAVRVAEAFVWRP